MNWKPSLHQTSLGSVRVSVGTAPVERECKPFRQSVNIKQFYVSRLYIIYYKRGWQICKLDAHVIISKFVDNSWKIIFTTSHQCHSSMLHKCVFFRRNLLLEIPVITLKYLVQIVIRNIEPKCQHCWYSYLLWKQSTSTDSDRLCMVLFI